MLKLSSLYFLSFCYLLLNPASGFSQTGNWTDNLDLNAIVQPVPQANKFVDPGYYVWCGSVTKAGDGKFYMLYSRWPLADGFESWPVTSEIAVAVSDNPGGPFKHIKVALPARGTQFWDGVEEGWRVSNRGWEATLSFCTLGSQHVKIFDESYNKEVSTASPGQTVTIEIKAALNQDWNIAEKGWIDIRYGNVNLSKLEVIETRANTGLFTSKYKVLTTGNHGKISISYGYLGFNKEAILEINN